jgi:hypothetical protein
MGSVPTLKRRTSTGTMPLGSGGGGGVFTRSLSSGAGIDELEKKDLEDVRNLRRDAAAAASGGVVNNNKSNLVNSQGKDFTSIGVHVILIAISVFIGYLWLLFLMVMESSYKWLHRHSVLSSVRLFKVSMIASLLLVRLSNKTLIKSIALKKERFHVLCSLTLDLLVMGSLASLEV